MSEQEDAWFFNMYGMSKEEARKKSIEAADMEFQMELAPNLNYQGEIDPSRGRLHGLPDNVRLNYKGVNAGDANQPDVMQTTTRGGKEIRIPIDPGTVNVIGADNAGSDTNTWPHEYRHRQGIRDEHTNRLMDSYNAQNEAQWKDSVTYWQQAQGHDSKAVAEQELLDIFNEGFPKNKALSKFAAKGGYWNHVDKKIKSGRKKIEALGGVWEKVK